MTLAFAGYIVLLLAAHLLGQFLVKIGTDLLGDHRSGNHMAMLLVGKGLIFLSNFFTLCALFDLIHK